VGLDFGFVLHKNKGGFSSFSIEGVSFSAIFGSFWDKLHSFRWFGIHILLFGVKMGNILVLRGLLTCFGACRLVTYVF
jgi:hypothetical protein